MHNRSGEHVEVVCTLATEVDELLALVDITRTDVCIDPWAGVGTIGAVLRSAVKGISVSESDLNPLFWWRNKLDALSQKFVQYVESNNITVVVCSPWFAVLDVFLAIVLRMDLEMICLHVPSHYVTNMPNPRFACVGDLVEQGRVVVKCCRDCGPLGRRCAWLIIFRTAELKLTRMKPWNGDRIEGIAHLPVFL